MATATPLPTRPASDTPPRRRRTIVLVLLAALGVLAALLATFGTGTRSEAPPGTPSRDLDSVGRIDGSTALIALLAHGDRISAYVCDGDAALGERFTGTLVDDRAALRANDGAQLTIDLTDEGASGTFTPAGTTTAQTFHTVSSTGAAGWYSADDGTVTANWVELADGTQTGVSTGPDEDRPKHKRKHRAPQLQVKPSGVSPKPGAQPEEAPAAEGGPVRETLAPPPGDGSGSLVDEGISCVKLVDGVCAVRGSIDPVELDGGTTARPNRVDGPLPILSGNPEGLAGS